MRHRWIIAALAAGIMSLPIQTAHAAEPTSRSLTTSSW